MPSDSKGIRNLQFVVVCVFIFVTQTGREEAKGQGPAMSPEQLLWHTFICVCFQNAILRSVFQGTPKAVNLSAKSLK